MLGIFIKKFLTLREEIRIYQLIWVYMPLMKKDLMKQRNSLNMQFKQPMFMEVLPPSKALAIVGQPPPPLPRGEAPQHSVGKGPAPDNALDQYLQVTEPEKTSWLEQSYKAVRAAKSSELQRRGSSSSTGPNVPVGTAEPLFGWPRCARMYLSLIHI